MHSRNKKRVCAGALMVHSFPIELYFLLALCMQVHAISAFRMQCCCGPNEVTVPIVACIVRRNCGNAISEWNETATRLTSRCHVSFAAHID